ncbi:MAG: hypothetical protein ABIP36_04560 [Acidimicrobiales bacterium]
MVASCSAGETADGADGADRRLPDRRECNDEAFRVPAPELVAEQTRTPMDLVFINHHGCGYSADGYVQFGREPAVSRTDGRVEVDVPSAFDVRYSLSSAEDDDAPLEEAAAARADGSLTVDVPETGCHRLVVELTRGDLIGRFVSLLQASEARCSPV